MFTDFEFNGQRLSDFGCMVCEFDSVGLETESIGNVMTINSLSRSKINKFDFIDSKYEEPFTKTIRIGKHACERYNLGNQEFDEYLIAHIARWLLKKRYCKFKMIYSDGKCLDMYHRGTFVDPKVLRIGERVVGMEFTFKANAPFGYYDDLDFYMNLSNMSDTFTIYDISDEVGYIYPYLLEIEILEDGDLVLRNSLTDEDVIINNCVAGEIIRLDGENKILTSSEYYNRHTTIYNDFNYNFLKVINDCGETDDYYAVDNEDDIRDNVYSTTLPCKIKLAYAPICKMGVL